MQEIATKLQAGQSLADSMQSVNYFPDLALAVVEAGETGGKWMSRFVDFHFITMDWLNFATIS